MVEIQNATIEVTKSPTSFMLTQIEEKSTWQYQQLTRLLLIIHIDHVTVTLHTCGIAMAVVACRCGGDKNASEDGTLMV